MGMQQKVANVRLRELRLRSGHHRNFIQQRMRPRQDARLVEYDELKQILLDAATD